MQENEWMTKSVEYKVIIRRVKNTSYTIKRKETKISEEK